MKQLFMFSFILISVFMTQGCEKGNRALLKKFSGQQMSNPSKMAENIDLAEAILKPRPYQLNLPRDPFKPLFGKLALVSQEEAAADNAPKFKVVGTLIKEGAPLALLEIPTQGTSLFREGSRIEAYVVKKIEAKRVILEKGDKIFILEIGEEK